jgi:capsular exopolysaccharide synthesis family protein
MNSPIAIPPENDEKFESLVGGLSEESKLELLEYWRSVTKRKWAILALGVVIAVVAAAIVYALTPVYRSTATVLIEQKPMKVLSIDDVYGGVSEQKEHYQTQVEIIKSREVGMRVVTALRLWDVPEFDPRLAEKSQIAQWKATLGIGGEKKPWTDERLANSAWSRFNRQLSVEPVRLSQLVKVSFESEDPKLASLVANTVAKEYIDSDREAHFKMTQQANTWLQDRTQSLRDKLSASEQALQAYRDKQGIASLSGSAQTMVGEQIAQITQRMMEARTHLAETESAYNQVKAIKNGDYSSVPAIIRAPNVAEAKKQESEAALKVAELGQRYGAEHTKMIEAQSQLKVARDNLNRQMQAVADSLTHEYDTARNTVRAFEGALGSAKNTVQSQNRQEFQLGVLDREVQSNKQLYDMFMNRAKETNVSGDLQNSVGRVVDQAVPPSTAVKPQKTQIIGIAFVLGLFGGVLVSLLLDKLDNTIKGMEDAERRLHVPVLAALPELGEKEGKTAVTAFLDKPDSVLAESVRTARTGVLLSDLDVPHKIVLVTSSLPGEGKTTTCTNLALAHAQTKRTLLIDADMRKPQVAVRLSLPPGSKGLSNLVSGTAQLSECIHRVPKSTLDVMPVGDVPPHPLELILSLRFKEALTKLSQLYDIIIIDSPPVELVSDALVLSPMATSTIFVTRAMSTPTPLVRKGLVRLKRSGGKVLGLIINHLDFKKSQRYYGEYSGYGGKYYGKDKYGYHYGYAAKHQEAS